jgi:hypothetical protein
MKSITFSLYGNKPMYTVGMLKNIDLAKTIYPEWTVEIYYNSSVPPEHIEKYKQDNVGLYDMTNSHVPGMFWRFLSKSDIFISRDTDSRLNLREKAAVDEWLASGKSFHVMRDHPAHCGLPILGGMWGVRKSTLGVDIEGTINQWLVKNPNSWGYGIDQEFLKSIYNFYNSQNQILIHDSLGIHKDKGIPFPTPHGPDYRFVGEIFDENDICRPDHHQNWLDSAPYERRR